MKPSLFQREKDNIHSISEYIAGDEMKEKLMPVYLLGAVIKPGLYHVPINTDLNTLLAISGGPSLGADVSDIQIKNETSRRLTKIDFEDLLSASDLKSPSLAHKDMVWIPNKEPIISNNTLIVITVVATVLTAALTAVVLQKEFKR